MANPKQHFSYNPHNHVKIWLSNKPTVFMNSENQMRLIAMRDKNPNDVITLIYDASLLEAQAIKELNTFCTEHRISPVDANKFGPSLTTENEKKLYEFYKDEINHLKEGGNLAVASDIIRWLPPVYTRGTYTDFDVPVDTTNLPATINVEAPLLLNIGSLKTRGKELILPNNDYIAVVDPQAAKEEIVKVQKGFTDVLGKYTNDFVEQTKKVFKEDSVNAYLFDFMRNRSESIYIERSKSNFQDGIARGSRELRQHINELMTDPSKFLDFNKEHPYETHKSVIQRLRADLNNQLGFMKWLFFRNEYNEIKTVLQQPDDMKLVSYLMKKERSLYLKSIVVCTTGPLAIANFLFGGYVFDTKQFADSIQPYSFNSYGLKKAFQSQNSIPMHENIIGMMSFLGAVDGALNDSSWLEEGARLQQSRGELLESKKTNLKNNLPTILLNHKSAIENHISQLEESCKGFFGFFGLERKQTKIKALRAILPCFEKDTFDTAAFKNVLDGIYLNKNEVYAGLFSSQTKTIIESLNQTCFEAIVFGLTQNRQIKLNNGTKPDAILNAPAQGPAEPAERYHSKGLNFFATSISSDSSVKVPDEPRLTCN